MKSFRNVVVFAAAIILVSAFGIEEADANTATRDSLAGNRLIEDRNDIFVYPQLAVNYANRIGFDYGGSQGNGSGLLLMGNERAAFGVVIHRGDMLADQRFPYGSQAGFLAGLPNPLGENTAGLSFQQPGTVLDLIAGFDLGGGLAGARLSIARGLDDDNPAGGDEDSFSQTALRLDGGYSLSGPLTLDTSLGILFSTAENVGAGDTVAEGSLFGVNLSARGYADLGQPFELGFLGDLVFNTISATDTTEEPDLETSNTTFGIQGGAGPVWQIEEEATIAGYGVLGYSMNSRDPDTNEDAEGGGPESSSSTVILPGFHIAADIALNDWLSFRSGAQYLWAIDGTSDETPDGDNETSTSGSGGFGWNAGLGAEFGNFRFDGSLAHGFLLNGPEVLGGGAPGLFGLASAEYSWE